MVKAKVVRKPLRKPVKKVSLVHKTTSKFARVAPRRKWLFIKVAILALIVFLAGSVYQLFTSGSGPLTFFTGSPEINLVATETFGSAVVLPSCAGRDGISCDKLAGCVWAEATYRDETVSVKGPCVTRPANCTDACRTGEGSSSCTSCRARGGIVTCQPDTTKVVSRQVSPGGCSGTPATKVCSNGSVVLAAATCPIAVQPPAPSAPGALPNDPCKDACGSGQQGSAACRACAAANPNSDSARVTVNNISSPLPRPSQTVLVAPSTDSSDPCQSACGNGQQGSAACRACAGANPTSTIARVTVDNMTTPLRSNAPSAPDCMTACLAKGTPASTCGSQCSAPVSTTDPCKKACSEGPGTGKGTQACNACAIANPYSPIGISSARLTACCKPNEDIDACHVVINENDPENSFKRAAGEAYVKTVAGRFCGSKLSKCTNAIAPTLYHKPGEVGHCPGVSSTGGGGLVPASDQAADVESQCRFDYPNVPLYSRVSTKRASFGNGLSLTSNGTCNSGDVILGTVRIYSKTQAAVLTAVGTCCLDKVKAQAAADLSCRTQYEEYVAAIQLYNSTHISQFNADNLGRDSNLRCDTNYFKRCSELKKKPTIENADAPEYKILTVASFGCNSFTDKGKPTTGRCCP